MKTKDIVSALNLADEEFIRQAGIAGGHLSDPALRTQAQKAEPEMPVLLHQETAKQRSVKRVWLAAACLALVAVSCGAWMLLKDRLAPGGASVGASVETSPSQSESAATEALITPTEKPAPTEGSELPEADSLEWIREHITFEQGEVGNSVLWFACRAMEQLYEDPMVRNCDLIRTSTFLGIVGLTDNTRDFTMVFKVEFDKTKTALSDVTVSQKLKFETLGDGNDDFGDQSVILKEIGELKLVP